MLKLEVTRKDNDGNAVTDVVFGRQPVFDRQTGAVIENEARLTVDAVRYVDGLPSGGYSYQVRLTDLLGVALSHVDSALESAVEPETGEAA